MKKPSKPKSEVQFVMSSEYSRRIDAKLVSVIDRDIGPWEVSSAIKELSDKSQDWNDLYYDFKSFSKLNDRWIRQGDSNAKDQVINILLDNPGIRTLTLYEMYNAKFASPDVKDFPTFANWLNSNVTELYYRFGDIHESGATSFAKVESVARDAANALKDEKPIVVSLSPKDILGFSMAGNYEIYVEGSELIPAHKKEFIQLKGGPGSGHEGHAGRPGKVGGSLPDDVAFHGTIESYVKSNANVIISRVYDEGEKAYSDSGSGFLWEDRDPFVKVVYPSFQFAVMDYGGILEDMPQIMEEDNIPSFYELRMMGDDFGYAISIDMNSGKSKFMYDSFLYSWKDINEFYDNNPNKILVHYSTIDHGITVWKPKKFNPDKLFDEGEYERYYEGVEYTTTKELKENNVVEKQLPIDDESKRQLMYLREQLFYDKTDELAEKVFTGDITIGEWEETMKMEIRNLHTSMAAIGAGGWDAMTSQMWGRLGTPLREQYRYLHGFAEHITENRNTISLDMIKSRSRLYGKAGGYSVSLMQAGAYIESQLPYIPRDGSTECLMGCHCFWELNAISRDRITGQKVQAVWLTQPAEHCDDCLEREGTTVIIHVPLGIPVPPKIGGF